MSSRSSLATDLVAVEKFCRMTGVSVKDVQRNIQSQTWTDGVHYCMDNGAVHISLGAFSKWVRTGK